MEEQKFRSGEQLWLHGERVTFVDYHDYASHRVGAAMVRRQDDTTVRVVPLWKLARDPAESLARANAIAAGPSK
jgi:hypothetical protein